MMLPAGPALWTPGASITEPRMVRFKGKASTSSALSVVDCCAPEVKAVSAPALTVTTSDTDFIVKVWLMAVVSPIRTRSVRSMTLNPDSSNRTVYSPGGRNGTTKSPFSDVVAVRAPCSMVETAVTVMPGNGSFCSSTTRPESVPVGFVCAVNAPVASSTVAAASRKFLVFIELSAPFLDNLDCSSAGGLMAGPIKRASMWPLFRGSVSPAFSECASRGKIREAACRDHGCSSLPRYWSGSP